MGPHTCATPPGVFLPPPLIRWVAGDDLDHCGRDLVEVCVRSALRTAPNHLVPALTFLVAAAGLTALLLPGLASDDALTMGHAMGRVFLFDYGIFVASWVSGWNMARRWRANTEMVEEVALAPLPPRHVGLALVSGNVAAWGLMVMALGAFEVMLCATLFFLSWNATYLAVALAAPFATLFHMETARLGHTMYAQGAMPRTQLRRLATNNFILIMVLVLVLSATGSIMTAMASLVAAFATLVPERVESMGPWMVGSIPAYALIAWLKRLLANVHLHRFERLWLMFQWWGPAELEHPAKRHRSVEVAAERWMVYQRALEELSVRPPNRVGHFTARYARMERNGNARAPVRPEGAHAAERGATAPATPPAPAGERGTDWPHNAPSRGWSPPP